MSRIVAACPAHERATRFDQMVHAVEEARVAVAEELSYVCRHQLPPSFLAMLITADGPLCCPSAGLARSVMRAAWREALAGEG